MTKGLWENRVLSRRRFSLALTSFLPGLGCQVGKNTDPSAPLLGTTSLAADMVAAIAGPEWELASLMGSGIDPHTYEPAYGALRKMARSNAVFFHGLHLEGKMAELLERMAVREPLRFCEICSEIPAEHLRGDGDQSHDPHVWMDVSLWARCPPVVARTLAHLDPDHAQVYFQRAAGLIQRYAQLERDLRLQLARVPEEKRVLVTAHDAFGYFGKAYGWRVEGVQGISTASEATTSRLEQLARLLVDRGIHAIFLESSVSPRTLQRLREITLRIDPRHEIRQGGTLYSDSLGDPGSGADTYEGMIMANCKTLVEALA